MSCENLQEEIAKEIHGIVVGLSGNACDVAIETCNGKYNFAEILPILTWGYGAVTEVYFGTGVCGTGGRAPVAAKHSHF